MTLREFASVIRKKGKKTIFISPIFDDPPMGKSSKSRRSDGLDISISICEQKAWD